MAHLADHLTNPRVRPQVVADVCALVRAEVGRTSGLAGLAIRAAYELVAGIRPGMISATVDELLDPFVDRLDPYYQEHLRDGTPVAEILTARRVAMARGLLEVTDARVGGTSNRTVRAAYRGVRGSAQPYVEAAAPGIAAIIRAHAPGRERPSAS